MGSVPLTFARRDAARLLAVILLPLALGCEAEDPPRLAGGGPHGDLACAGCHQAPVGEGPVVGLTSTAACRDCHPFEELADHVELASISFTHRDHVERIEGQGTPCSACHAHGSGDSDLRVDMHGCFICHAELPGRADHTQAAFLAEGTCLPCHGPPAQPELVRHARVIDGEIACLSCHYNVLQGAGTVPETKCLDCHGVREVAEPLASYAVDDAEAIHRQHVFRDKEMSCQRCHEALQHRTGAFARSVSLRCEDCHAPGDPALVAPIDSTVHRSQQFLYSGLADESAPMVPAVKFAARVSCASCHSHETMANGDSMSEMRAECQSCHPAPFGGLLDGWVRGMRSRTREVGSYLRTAAADPRVKGSAAADSTIREAIARFEQVEAGNGVHNIPAADAMLRRALRGGTEAWGRAGVRVPPTPNLGPAPAETRCVSCHYGVELRTTTFRGEPFDHEKHVMSASLDCTECHGTAALFQEGDKTFDPEHGLTHLKPADCTNCHHRQAPASSCSNCHGDALVSKPLTSVVPVSVDGEPALDREVEWTHALHASVGCRDCHGEQNTIAPAAGVTSCTACHEQHHDAGRSCAQCHGIENTREAHDEDTHFGCADCHAEETIERLTPDRGLCLTCHGDKATGHEEDSGSTCTSCHFDAEPHELREQLVTGEE